MAEGNDSLFPSSIKEAGKIAIVALGALVVAKKMAPKQAYSLGLADVPPGWRIVVDAASGSAMLAKTG